MISLVQFINNSYNVFELEEHFKLEFNLYKQFKERLLNLNESGGAFDGQIKLSEILTRGAFKNLKNKIGIIVQPFIYKYTSSDSNIPKFFDEIVVKFTKDKSTAFLSGESIYDKDKKILKNLTIRIKFSDIKNDENKFSYILCYKAIAHEVLHIWDEYKGKLKGSKVNVSDLTKINTPYNKAIQDESLDFDNPKTLANKLFYHLSKFEQNAYFSEFKTEFDKIDKSKIKSYKDAYNHFIQTESYMIYSFLFDKYNEMRNGKLGKRYIEQFVDRWNDLENKNETDNKIFKRIDDIIKKSKRKINKIIPSIYIEYFEREDKLAKKIKEGINEFSRRLMIDTIKINNLDI